MWKYWIWGKYTGINEVDLLVCVYMHGCVHRDKLIYYLLIYLFSAFSLHDSVAIYMMPLLRNLLRHLQTSPRAVLGIRENGVHMVCRFAGLFSCPLLVLVVRDPWPMVTSAWSEGMLVYVQRWELHGRWLSGWWVPFPTSVPLPLAATGSSRTLWVRRSWGSKVPSALETAGASPSCAVGFTQLWAAASALHRACSRGWRWPRCRAGPFERHGWLCP